MEDELKTQVELSFACSNLKNMDLLSLSDPQIILYMRESFIQPWNEVGRTEIIWNNLNPRFVKSIPVTYCFEKNQMCRFVVIDIDDKTTTNADKQDFIGQIDCTLAEIVTFRGSLFRKELFDPTHPNDNKRGEIAIRSEQVSVQNALITFTNGLRAEKLDKKDFFGTSGMLLHFTHPFIIISRVTENGEFQPVHRTEFYKRNLNPTWRPFSITSQKLCNGDDQRTLRFECYDYNNNGKHNLIGSCDTSLSELLKNQPLQFQLIHPDKKLKKKKYINSGTLFINNVTFEQRYTFLEYIKGGYEINLMVAIDFTASNGDPLDPNSLHYRNTYPSMNQYQMALNSIGAILDYYDADHSYPVYGFGAKIPPEYNVSHCFPCNLDQRMLNVTGVPGIMRAYEHAASRVVLHGPTNFSQIINQAALLARSSANVYQILLIVTDGVISDMAATTREIVLASQLPLSIIIVGVGDADFTNMDILDADDVPLSFNGENMSRDIVQFVPFTKFKNSPMEKLAESVLEEIPEQFCSYMRMKKIEPGLDRKHSLSELKRNLMYDVNNKPSNC
ncbi:hypothetical protein AKO1_012868 [Acrasis kona]|uniref:C2 domain-containing protein n=1 Tax=Acrasis kona TaxID=1008807 RepID=A0AAW2YVC6_9EUKA